LKVLVVGSGGREHALGWALAGSESVASVASAPGNPGLASIGPCLPVGAGDVDGLVDCARRESFDLVMVGPEAPLVAGLGDRLRREGIACFGPDAAAARLEGSKVFAKQCMVEAGVPTAAFEVCTSMDGVRAAIDRLRTPVVIKADGLAAGKGVCIAATAAEAEEFAAAALVGGRFGDSGRRLLVEEFLDGEEVSLFVVTDGTASLALPAARDYKRLGTGGAGPNTGGMGSYAPAELDATRQARVLREIVEPVLAGLRERGTPYRGLLYCGLMWTASGPVVLEFNCRFGDPETQALVPLAGGDLGALLMAAARGETLPPLEWKSGSCVTVVLASAGYPEQPRTGRVVLGVGRARQRPGVEVFHAGTELKKKRLISCGGRVLSVSGRGKNLDEARQRAYDGLKEIEMDGAQFRTDIGRGVSPVGAQGESE
jgi:phosphoribosylamine--glycine ligase